MCCYHSALSITFFKGKTRTSISEMWTVLYIFFTFALSNVEGAAKMAEFQTMSGCVDNGGRQFAIIYVKRSFDPFIHNLFVTNENRPNINLAATSLYQDKTNRIMATYLLPDPNHSKQKRHSERVILKEHCGDVLGWIKSFSAEGTMTGCRCVLVHLKQSML